MKRFLTSALWTWVIILLSLLCLVAGHQQIQTVQDHQARLEDCTQLAKAFNALEEGLWNLEAVIQVRKKDPTAEVQQRMMQDLIRLKKTLADARRLPTTHTEMQGSLIRTETNLILLERNLSIEDTNLDEADANLRRALQEVRSASSRLWQQYQEIAVEITNRWLEVNFLVLVSCLLAAFLAFLLRAYHRNLMDRKEAERALRESEDRYRSLIEVSPDAILVHRDGKILFLNTTGANMLGAPSATQLIGTSLCALSADSDNCVTWGLARTSSGEVRPSHHRMVRLDHTQIDVEIVATEFAYQDHPAIQMVIRDITDLKRQSQALAASERRFKSLFENVSEGVYRSTPDGQILDANPALVGMLGYDSIDELRAISITRDLYVDGADRDPAVTQLKADGTLNNYELRLRRKDGSVLTVLENAHCVLADSGEVEYYEGTLTDISHIKLVEEALVDARDQALNVSRMKSEFLANMSHEIRTPMNGIIGMTDLMCSTELSEEQREYADAVRRSAQYLMNIINDVLDFSKIEAGRVELETIEFNLRESVEDVVELLAEQAQEKGLDFNATFDSDLPATFFGDPYRFQQVITNLAGNAIKFTQSGNIAIRVHHYPADSVISNIEVEVLDTGIGIAPEVKKRLFQPFSQGDGSTTRRFGGTGLGLAISRQLVELMGGSISVESRPQGGSRFYFRIPLTIASERSQIPLAPPEWASRSPRALIALPRTEQRESVLQVISSLGIMPVYASSGQELLLLAEDARTQNEAFPLILLHDGLPDMNSVTLATHLSAAGIDSASTTIRFVRVRNRSLSRQDDSRFAATLSDPFRQSTLLDAVQRVLNGAFNAIDIHELSKALIEDSLVRPQATSRILVAEDNAINQRVARRMLEKMGIETDIVDNGLKAVEAFRSCAYPIILMDCQMPEMDGFQATAEIRAWEESNHLPRTPIIAMTAHAMPGDRERCLEAGMDDYISKPVSMASLQAVISRWITEQSAEHLATEAASS
jgi:two-component system, sensor histidine kinase and response regulator